MKVESLMSDGNTAKVDSRPTNRFLRTHELDWPEFKSLRREFEGIYRQMGKTREDFGAKDPSSTRIHWSRDWEYPWAVLSSNPNSGQRVLDCGCGGSPFLPYLSRIGCDAWGADPGLFERSSHFRHTWARFKDMIWNIRSGKKSVWKAIKGFFHDLPIPNDLWTFSKNPAKFGYRLNLRAESLDRMSFQDSWFDRVYCLSVIEHLPEAVAYQGMREMARVLKPGGLLTLTVDHEGDHVTPELRGAFEKLIEASGLELYGTSDFTVPSSQEIHGTYNVFGFVLRKPA